MLFYSGRDGVEIQGKTYVKRLRHFIHSNGCSVDQVAGYQGCFWQLTHGHSVQSSGYPLIHADIVLKEKIGELQSDMTLVKEKLEIPSPDLTHDQAEKRRCLHLLFVDERSRMNTNSARSGFRFDCELGTMN